MMRTANTARELRRALADCDPGGLSGSEALELVETLAQEKVCAATPVRAAMRVEECGTYRARGACVGGAVAGQDVGHQPQQAGELIETAEAIEGLAATREAFAAGRISQAQAAEVAKAAAVDPPPRATCWRWPSRLTGAV
ncbi:MAG: hypothetical protein ABR592_04040 [Nitriliruptorales bacterium]